LIQPQSSSDLQTYNLVHNFGDTTPGSLRTYVVRANETLQSIASTVYGDSSLWYVIAEANGLTLNSSLPTGTTLTIPNTARFGQLTSDTHVVYNQASIVGSTLPNLQPPPPQNPSECAMIAATIVVVALSVVSVVATAGIGAALVPAEASVVGTIGTYAATGAVVYAATDALKQETMIGFDLQKNFNWGLNGVAGAALVGGLSGGALGVGAAAKAASSLGTLSSFGNWAARGASAALDAGAAAFQSMEQEGGHFGWSGVAGIATGGLSGYLSTTSSITQGEEIFAAEQESYAGVKAADETLRTLNTVNTVNRFLSPWANAAGYAVDYARASAEARKQRGMAPPNWFSSVGATLAAATSVVDNQSLTTRVWTSAANMYGGLAIASIAGLFGANAKTRNQIIASTIGMEVGNFIGYGLDYELQPRPSAPESHQGLTSDNATFDPESIGMKRPPGLLSIPGLLASNDAPLKSGDYKVETRFSGEVRSDEVPRGFVSLSAAGSDWTEVSFGADVVKGYQQSMPATVNASSAPVV
ncbi:MAG TPA: LysM domain-containing protein, partial [Steroidobacteraceae bacterium]|nr:LysM domain-containing protein [Steroidobacteraceae bacterium]